MNKLKFRVALGLLFIIIGVSFLASDFISFEREEAFTRVNVEINDLLAAQNKVETPQEDVTPSEEPVEVPTPEPVEEAHEYEPFAGVLDIPKIGFNKGFYRKGSSLNDVRFNLKILDVSSYTGEEKGNVIIIGHSGNYSNSYFANLYRLDVNDTASIQYEGKTYRYKIVNIYNEIKDGTVTVYRDVTKNCLTLVTCTKDDDTKQTVYIFEQYSVE